MDPWKWCWCLCIFSHIHPSIYTVCMWALGDGSSLSDLGQSHSAELIFTDGWWGETVKSISVTFSSGDINITNKYLWLFVSHLQGTTCQMASSSISFHFQIPTIKPVLGQFWIRHKRIHWDIIKVEILLTDESENLGDAYSLSIELCFL